MEKLKTGNGLSKEDYVTQLRDFVIAATAKDCSIMTAFLPLDEGETWYICSRTHTHSLTVYNSSYPIVFDSAGKRYGYRVAVVDLDPKPLANMEYWYKSDTDTVHNFLQVMEEAKKSGEQAPSPLLPRCYKAD